ncbi:hypothetical protein [Candidatus Gromoviella agglomerans]|uniref:hypothetical protein n=1 Tax=Candidatus Gromoviella agglomerans TaxID=2806609 RepID=UPI001E5FC567|nr:hypothetical protein [Candidatus Gromoviella agglomerans]UFX98512.1 hypothetical protein Gromo_00422 [Candidatus Gromoviella agglomerans]
MRWNFLKYPYLLSIALHAILCAICFLFQLENATFKNVIAIQVQVESGTSSNVKGVGGQIDEKSQQDFENAVELDHSDVKDDAIMIQTKCLQNELPVSTEHKEKTNIIDQKTNDTIKEVDKTPKNVDVAESVQLSKVENQKQNTIKEVDKTPKNVDVAESVQLSKVENQKQIQKQNSTNSKKTVDPHVLKDTKQKKVTNKKPSAKGKFGFGLGDVFKNVPQYSVTSLSASDTASVRGQIVSIWSISVMDYKKIQNIVVSVEVILEDSCIAGILVIDDESSHSHEYYAIVRESVINALRKCAKLNLSEKLSKGQHKVKFKFLC